MESEMKAAEGWETKTLRDLAVINYGKSPANILSEDGLYPVVGTGGSDRLGDDYLHEGESIILGRKGTIDRVYFATGRFWTIDTAYYLSDFTESLPRWLFYFLQTIDLRQMNEATGVPSLSRDELYKIEIPTPPKPEQTKIAEILSTVDRAIEQTEALIAKQQRIKTGLMQDLLTRSIDEHGNLRSEQTHQFKDSPLGRIPVEWEVQPLGNALHKAKGFLQTGPFGSQLHANEYVQEGIPVIMPQDIFEGCVLEIMIARIPKNRAEDLRKHRVQVNDIVFSRRGDLSRTAVIGDREVGWLCGTGCFLLRASSNEMDTHWLADLYQHHLTQRQIETNAVGSTMPSLNNTVMEQLTMAFPSLEEQHEITCRREAIDRNISAIRNHLLKLRSLKTALMQDLLTGKKRVTPLLDKEEGTA